MSTLDYSNVPKQRFGQALAAARQVVGLQEREAADAIGISVRKLRRWELGRAAPGPEMADAIGAAYGLDLAGNFTPRVPIVFDEVEGGVIIAGRVVPYVPGTTENDDFLEEYVATIRQLRALGPDEPVHLRSTDINVLATVLDLRDDDLDSRIAFWTGMSAESMVGTRERLILAAVVIGVVAGATIGGFTGDVSASASEFEGEQTVEDVGDPLEPDLDIGSASFELSNDNAIVMELDDGLGELELDFSGIELDFGGIDDVDLSLDLEVDDDLEPTAERTAEPAPEPTPEPTPEPDTETAASSVASPTPEPAAEPTLDADLEASLVGEELSPEGGDVAGTPTVDDWVRDGLIDDAEDAPVDMLKMVDDGGSAELVENLDDLDDDDDPEIDAEESGETWDFDGTRDWVRQDLNGEWVDNWVGDGVALTGSELWSASSGDTSIDMNANGPGTFSHTLDTIEGETYEISFDLSGNPHGQRGVKTLDLSAGDDVASFSTDTSTISRYDMNWETSTMTFVADGATTDIMFSSTTAGSVGAVIDSISISLVG